MSSPAGTALEGAVSAAPVAGAAAAPRPAPAAPVQLCDNCGASVTGRYCANCGQRLEPPVHTLWHFMAVAAEDVTHADSRLWRTLAALLFRPGYLTHEFLAGRRARYLPPVRLYLVLSVVFFLSAAALHSKAQVLQVSTTDNGVPKAAHLVPLTEATSIPGSGARPGESVAERNARECAMINYDGPWHTTLTPEMQKACLRVRADNARSLMQSVRHNLPRVMFVFLPLIAALMMLMYSRPRHYYVEHLLLLVHNHAFVFLMLPLAWVVGALLPSVARWLDLALSIYIAWYLYRSMRTVYGQGRALTLAKLTALAFVYFVFGVVMFTVNFAYSALTLD
ncbi:MAG: DUF3667 domain-containing protein [Steroidobacteraceae bacterium]